MWLVKHSVGMTGLKNRYHPVLSFWAITVFGLPQVQLKFHTFLGRVKNVLRLYGDGRRLHEGDMERCDRAKESGVYLKFDDGVAERDIGGALAAESRQPRYPEVENGYKR